MSFRSYNWTNINSRNTVAQKPKPTIKKPSSASDCRVIMKRGDEVSSQKKTQMSENDVKMASIQKQIESLQKELETLTTSNQTLNRQLAQYEVNKTYLSKWMTELEKQESVNNYVERCRSYINTYDWVHPDVDEIDSDKNELPYDLFDYLNIPFQPLDSYTSDELKSIAHYIKASELVQKSRTMKVLQSLNVDTYAELLNASDDRYDSSIIGDIEGCDGEPQDSDDESCCHKRYAWTVCKLEDVTLDSTEIIYYNRVN